MRRWLIGTLIVFLVPTASGAAEGRVLRERWFESRTDKGKLGYLHSLAREVERDGRKLILTTLHEELSYLRSGDPYKETQKYYTLETESGAVVELGYSTNLSKEQHLTVHGQVEGHALVLRIMKDGQPTKYTQAVPWDAAAVGLYAADRFFSGKKLRVGDVHIIKEFNVSVNRVVAASYAIKGFEETKVAGKRRQLFRVEQSYPKDLYVSKSTVWLDDKGGVAKIQDDTPIFGVVNYELSTREVAARPFVGQVADAESPISINRAIAVIPNPPDQLRVRVTLEDDQPHTVFARDGRQQVMTHSQNKVELTLLARAVQEASSSNEQPTSRPAAEYLDSNFFIRSDDPLVQKLAKQAVGKEAEPRKQTRLIKKWMKEHFRGTYAVPFATADEVARTLEGDCSEMGILAAAMCRSVGIPSRVVFGLVYDAANPGFGGHLWTEVYLNGRWEPFDPTGIVDKLHAAYLKIADYSMKDVLNPDVLIEVRRAFAGKMRVEVLERK